MNAGWPAPDRVDITVVGSPAEALETWAEEVGRLSPPPPVDDAGPSFELEVHP